MIGVILNFDIKSSSGVISGEDGKRYSFSTAQWNSDISPKAQLKIDFAIDNEDESKAIEIYVAQKEGFTIKELDLNKGLSFIQSHAKSPNKLGMSVAIASLFSLPLPFMPDLGFFGGGESLYAFDNGLLFVLVNILIIGLFYIDKKIPLRIVILVYGFMLITPIKGVLEILERVPNLWDKISIGFVLIPIFTVLMLIVSFKKRAKDGENNNV
jgi:hypothetical protein